MRGSKDNHVQINGTCWVLTLELVEKFGKPIESCQRGIKTYSNILGSVIGTRRSVKRAWNEPGRHHQSSPRLVVYQSTCSTLCFSTLVHLDVFVVKLIY